MPTQKGPEWPRYPRGAQRRLGGGYKTKQLWWCDARGEGAVCASQLKTANDTVSQWPNVTVPWLGMSVNFQTNISGTVSGNSILQK